MNSAIYEVLSTHKNARVLFVTDETKGYKQDDFRMADLVILVRDGQEKILKSRFWIPEFMKPELVS